MYRLRGFLPYTEDSAQRQGLVTREQIIQALVRAVDNPCRGVHIVEVPEIRGFHAGFAAGLAA